MSENTMSENSRAASATGVGRRAFVVGAAAAAGTAALAGPLAAGASAAGFGWSDDGSNYVVDTGASLVFKVSKSNGDLSSLVYKGTEYQGYGGKNSHIESGLGASTVTIAQSGSTILVSVAYGTLRHHYAARSGENNVYLWTNRADTSVASTRFILRVKAGLFLNDEPDSYTYAPTTIEASDVFQKSDGQTRSKHYSKLRVIDYDYVGWSANGVGLWIVRSNHEKASGGPFYRSLLRHQSADGGGLYEILHYAQNQTENERFGLQGPYVIALTDGGAPSSSLYAGTLTTSWADSLGISGYVASGGRGRVAGVGITGRNTAYAYTVGLANSAAQYWGSARSSDGFFSIGQVLPGTYTLTVYKGELAVYTTSVSVTAGGTTTLNSIAIPSSNDPSNAGTIWRIGDWNGTPGGFKNADLMTYAHPSDVRASAWTGNVVIGSGSETSAFPCYLWKDVNSGLIVYFKLTAAQGRRRAHAADRGHHRVRERPSAGRRQRLLDVADPLATHAAEHAVADERVVPREQLHVHVQRSGERVAHRHEPVQHAEDQRGERVGVDRVPERGDGDRRDRPAGVAD